MPAMADDQSASRAAGRAPPHAQRLVATFERHARELPRARHTVGTALDAWGYADAAPGVVLAVGELVTNAIVHGQGTVELTLTVNSDQARIEVADDGNGQPAIRPADPTGAVPGAWGLRIVDQLAAAWGSHNHGGRTTVWMTYQLTNPPNGRRP